MREESTNAYYSYNITKYINFYLKSLVYHICRLYTHILSICKIMRLVAKSLIYCNKLRDDNNFSAIAKDLKQYI